MHPLKTYLTEILLIRSTGANTPETSFYGPFANLLNAAGQAIKPRVRCVMGLKNQGAGMPDGGLYTPTNSREATMNRSPVRRRLAASSSARRSRTTPV